MIDRWNYVKHILLPSFFYLDPTLRWMWRPLVRVGAVPRMVRLEHLEERLRSRPGTERGMLTWLSVGRKGVGEDRPFALRMKVWISFLEIHKEQVYDLLSDGKSSLSVREVQSGLFRVIDLNEFQVTSV